MKVQKYIKISAEGTKGSSQELANIQSGVTGTTQLSRFDCFPLTLCALVCLSSPSKTSFLCRLTKRGFSVPISIVHRQSRTLNPARGHGIILFPCSGSSQRAAALLDLPPRSGAFLMSLRTACPLSSRPETGAGRTVFSFSTAAFPKKGKCFNLVLLKVFWFFFRFFSVNCNIGIDQHSSAGQVEVILSDKQPKIGHSSSIINYYESQVKGFQCKICIYYTEYFNYLTSISRDKT